MGIGISIWIHGPSTRRPPESRVYKPELKVIRVPAYVGDDDVYIAYLPVSADPYITDAVAFEVTI
jgi:hypothetical protein